MHLRSSSPVLSSLSPLQLSSSLELASIGEHGHTPLHPPPHPPSVPPEWVPQGLAAYRLEMTWPTKPAASVLTNAYLEGFLELLVPTLSVKQEEYVQHRQ